MPKLLKSPLLLIIIVSLPTIFSLLSKGFYGASDDIHIAWLHQMDKAIKNGQIPPRYVSDLSYGFGYPLFNFVFPLPFYIGEFFHLVGFNFVDSIKIVFGLSLLLSALSMYFLAKELSNSLGGVTASIIYLYTPYRANDVYNRGAIGESFAFIFFPIIILSLIKLAKSKRQLPKKWLGIGGLAIGSLILSHNIAAYMFLPFAGILAILLNIRIKLLLQIFIIGLLISIYFWLPALIDSQLMHYSTVFNFIDHFPTIKQLFLPYWGYGASVPGPYDGMSFYLGIGNIVLLMGGCVLLVANRFQHNTNSKTYVYWLISSCMISLFMMNFRSSPIWQHLPLLPYFQFPWRFLMLTTFFTPLLITAFFQLKIFNLLCFTLTILSIFANVSYFKPNDFLARTDEYYLNRYIPIPSASDEYKKLGEEYLRLPKNTEQRPKSNYPLLNSQGKIINLIFNNPFKVSFEYNGPGEIIEFYRYFFPGWYVKVDGIKTKIEPGNPYGQITFEVPAGNHYVNINFSETYPKILLDLISMTTILVAANYIIRDEK